MASIVILTFKRTTIHDYFLNYSYGKNKIILLSIFVKVNYNKVCTSEIKVKNNIKLQIGYKLAMSSNSHLLKVYA